MPSNVNEKNIHSFIHFINPSFKPLVLLMYCNTLLNSVLQYAICDQPYCIILQQ